jgi:hypothetical protein
MKFRTADCRWQILQNPVVLTCAFFILISASAGSASAQSFFNSRGLGEITPSGEARIAALAEPFALSTLNPGILVGLDKTSFHVTALAAATIGTQGDNSRLLRDVRPATFGIAAPLPFQTRLFGGINQRFGQDFDVWSESLADTAYRRHIVGRGGIYSLRAGLAKSVFDKICVGVEYGHIAGGSRERWRFELENGSYTSTDTIEVDYTGNTFRVGGSFQSRLLSLAGYYEPALNLNARRHKRVHGVIRDTTRTYELSLPHSLSLAAAFNAVNRFGVNIGLTLNPWQDATITADNSTSDLGYKNVWRGSVGAEYAIDSLHPVRVGYSHQTWYYGSAYAGVMDRAPIKENGIHLGTSIPVPKFGSLDIAGELLFRASYSQGAADPPLWNPANLKEVAGRLMLTLSYSEAWMKRTRRWGY